MATPSDKRRRTININASKLRPINIDGIKRQKTAALLCVRSKFRGQIRTTPYILSKTSPQDVLNNANTHRLTLAVDPILRYFNLLFKRSAFFLRWANLSPQTSTKVIIKFLSHYSIPLPTNRSVSKT